LLLEKPTGLDAAELVRIRNAVRGAGVRSIVSFELRYNPLLMFARWLRSEGWLGDIRFARTQYLSRVTNWYSGWEWVRTRESGRSHLLAAGCHAVDALRWCSGLEPVEVSAFHTHFTAGYEWPTSIVAKLTCAGASSKEGRRRSMSSKRRKRWRSVSPRIDRRSLAASRSGCRSLPADRPSHVQIRPFHGSAVASRSARVHLERGVAYAWPRTCRR